MSEDTIPFEPVKDAMEDIRLEQIANGLEPVECFFGSAIVTKNTCVFGNNDSESRLINLLVPHPFSHEEAVGISYIYLKNNFPDENGWVVTKLLIEEMPVFADVDDFRDYGDLEDLPLVVATSDQA